jgi:putative flavoprotein involved in K+ transport
MRKVTTIIIGGGQAGLAMSYHLSDLSIDHVILERGQVANSWAKERWDSLRLLTPNWQSRLPGYQYDGDQPDAFRTMDETVSFLQDYAHRIEAPIECETEVISVTTCAEGYLIETNKGDWQCQSLVLASGACNIANIPKIAGNLPPSIRSMSPFDYKRPDDLDVGHVLVVGASATGVQLAQEIQESGRQVTLAVGEHVRVPRTYRCKDIEWWMDVSGVLDTDIADVDDITRARHVPSMQLIGSSNRKTISLNSLQAEGVEIAGRVMNIEGSKVQFSGSLANVCALADLKMNRLLQTIDNWIDENCKSRWFDSPYRLRPTRVPENPLLELDLTAERFQTVIWATGFRPDYSWLNLPVLDHRGELKHNNGIVDAPGVYALGLPFLRKRRSSLIDGVGEDAGFLAMHLKNFVDDQFNKAA